MTGAGRLDGWEGLRAPGLLVAADYDGTLVEIVPRPEQAAPDRELLLLLRALADAPGVEALVLSGRPVRTLLEWLPVPGLHLVGTHGAEWRPSGGRPRTLLAPDGAEGILRRVVASLRAALAEVPGALVEDKGAGVAAHCREVAPADLPLWRERFEEAVRGLPAELEVQSGKRVEEIRFRGVSKGRALGEVRRRRGWEDLPVLALGDDRTDESVFATLGPRDRSFRVGPGRTRAGGRLKEVAGARELLAGLAAARQGAGGKAGRREHDTG